MKIRILLTLALVAIFLLVTNLFGFAYSPITGVATAAQFDDSVSSYSYAKFIRDGNVQTVALIFFLFAVSMIWAGPISKALRGKYGPWLVLTMAGMFASCSPYKTLDAIVVKPNETAWAIPLDALSKDGQVKFNSVDYLNQKKIAAKRIMVDKVPRSTGRMWYDLEWLPATMIVVIDRSLVTRQWTDGSAEQHNDDYGIGVVTQDSVKLRVGLTITASIEEDDASTYLYYHGARKLSEVLDQNIRSFAVSELTREYSQLSLMEAQIKGDEIYAQLFQNAAKTFKAKGVTIQYLGNAEGLTYADPAVQHAINARYLAEQDAATAQQEQNAQKIRNSTRVLNAQAEADAARKLFEVKEASTFQNELNIRTMTAQAALKWNGQLPANILPSNSPMLMNVGVQPK